MRQVLHQTEKEGQILDKTGRGWGGGGEYNPKTNIWKIKF